MNEKCQFCGSSLVVGLVGTVWSCQPHAELVQTAMGATAPEAGSGNARDLVDSVIRALTATVPDDEEMKRAASRMLALRAVLWPPPLANLATVHLAERSLRIENLLVELKAALVDDTAKAVKLLCAIRVEADIPASCAVAN